MGVVNVGMRTVSLRPPIATAEGPTRYGVRGRFFISVSLATIQS